MRAIRNVEILPYEGVRLPYRIAVGDVIRCSAFENCFLFNNAIRSLPGKLWVWNGSETHLRYREQQGEGLGSIDPGRAQTNYLVEQVAMTVGDGPHDVFPNQYRMSRDVSCLRLTADDCLSQATERICFSVNEAMSMCGIEESEIELIGYAKLPIVWEQF
jgi:hypothetical protein